MNRPHLLILLLLISIVGCASSSPRGIAWGFKKRPKPELADRGEKDEDSPSSKSSMSKAFRKKPSTDKRDLNPKSDRGNDRELAVSDLLERAREFDDRNDHKQAEKLYQEVLEKDRDNPVALRRLANIADLQNRFRDAEEYYNRGLALTPNDPELLNDLGYSFYLQERYDESEQTLRKALAINPDHVYAMNNLGYLLAKRAQQSNDYRDYQVALEMFQQANGPEAAQQTIQELFPNGPPQALAQTSNQSNPFAARPTTPPSSRNPFEPNQPNAGPGMTNSSPQNGPSITSTNPFQSNQNEILPTSASPSQGPNSNLGYESQSSPAMNAQSMQNPGMNSNPTNELAQPNNFSQPNNFAQSNANGINQPQAPMNSINITPGNPVASADSSPAIQPNDPSMQAQSQQQLWNSTPANGGGSDSAMWEAAQRSAAQMSLNAMFPVANAAGQPSTSPQQAAVGQLNTQGLSSPNPSTGWNNSAHNPLDRTVNMNGAPGTNPSNGTYQTPMQNQNQGGWQSQPNNNGGGLPGPNPFEDLPALPATGSMQNNQNQMNQVRINPGQYQNHQGQTQPGNGIKPVGATATDIELFEAELMQDSNQNPNSSNPNSAAADQRPSSGTASARY